MMKLLRPNPGTTLLDVGTGTGHFARRFSVAQLRVTGVDADAAALNYARSKSSDILYVAGDALKLPFADASFDYCAAVTSLCFVTEPAAAVAEMWRVARCGIVLGLLHRHSLLSRHKAGRGAYAGARWDDAATVTDWLRQIKSPPVTVGMGYAVFLPGGSALARAVEHILPVSLPRGGFLAAISHK